MAHSRSSDAWSSTCKSADGDPRQANVHTSVTAFGDTLLKFRETGNYEFRIGSAKCSAQVTRTRTFSRSSHQVNERAAEPAGLPAQALGAADAPAAAAGTGPDPLDDATDREPTASTLDGKRSKVPGDRPVRHDCEPSGEAREIRMPRPVNWLQPGASYRLTPVIVDATGCVVAKGPFTYTVEPETDAVHVGPRSGLIQVAPQASEGKYTVVIRSGQLREVTEVPVITREGLAAFLEAPTEPPVGTSERTSTAPELLGAAPAAAADNATPRKWWFTGLAGLVILGLGSLGLRLLRAGSRPTLPPPQPRTPSVGGAASTLPGATPRAAVASGQLALTVVPPPVAPETSQPNTRSNPPPKPRPGMETTNGEGRACPQCGTRYTDGSVFCGVDGAKLPEPSDRLLERRS